MSRPDPARGVIAVLRPAAEARGTAAALRRLRLPAVAAPAMRIRFTGRAGALRPRAFPLLTLFTSPRGVAGLLRRLAPAARARLRRARPAAAVVGPATAAAARAAGYRVIAGAGCNGAAQLQRALARLPLAGAAWAAGALLVVSPERAGPLPAFLRRLGARRGRAWRVTRRADYDTRPDLAGLRRLRGLLRRGGMRALVVGSPRQMAFALRGVAPLQGAALRGLPCVAPGKTTAAALRRLGFRRVAIAPALRAAACRQALAARARRPRHEAR